MPSLDLFDDEADEPPELPYPSPYLVPPAHSCPDPFPHLVSFAHHDFLPPQSFHPSSDPGLMMLVDDASSDEDEFLEYDPSRRYGRYSEVLGRGAMKTVYRAYDLVDCKEVAWNKVKTPTEGPEEQVLCAHREVHLLQRLNHRGILKLYSAWVDKATSEINFITELCSSTLLNFRLKHKHISRKAVQCWGRQILTGLAHLHAQTPPIIHRDLKCENIFVKCNSNTILKIGDFGSAAFLDETHHMHTIVGTPEFMAPEMYQEDYDELVDVYSFGMCMLELLTRECPYSECKNVAQIYKKVVGGEKPRALHKVKDPQALQLINRCLLPVSQRPSAQELLDDPFLQCEESVPSPNRTERDTFINRSIQNVAKLDADISRNSNGKLGMDPETFVAESADGFSGEVFSGKSEPFGRTYHVMGKVEDENTLSLKMCIEERGHLYDIEFQFDLRSDTPTSVSEEMVRALDYPESESLMIADLIHRTLAAITSNSDDVSFEALTREDDHKLPSGSHVSNGVNHDSIDRCVSQQVKKHHDSHKQVLGNDNADEYDFTLCTKLGNAAALQKHATERRRFSMDRVAGETMHHIIGPKFVIGGGTALDHNVGHVINGSVETSATDSNHMVEGDETKIINIKTSSKVLWDVSCHFQPSIEDQLPVKCNVKFDRRDNKGDAGFQALGFHKRLGNISVDKVSVEGFTNSLLGKCLYWNHDLPSKSPKKLQQIPAGIGIILTPSLEQGFRRPLKCVCA